MTGRRHARVLAVGFAVTVVAAVGAAGGIPGGKGATKAPTGVAATHVAKSVAPRRWHDD